MKSPKTTQELFRGEAQAWLEDCREVALKQIDLYGKTTSEEVEAECPRPKFVHPNLMGSIFKTNDFQHIGYTKAKKPSSNGRVIGLWARRVV